MCGALRRRSESSSVYPLITITMRCSVIIPSFASIACKLREEFANKGFELYQIIYRDERHLKLVTCVHVHVSLLSPNLENTILTSEVSPGRGARRERADGGEFACVLVPGFPLLWPWACYTVLTRLYDPLVLRVCVCVTECEGAI